MSLTQLELDRERSMTLLFIANFKQIVVEDPRQLNKIAFEMPDMSKSGACPAFSIWWGHCPSVSLAITLACKGILYLQMFAFEADLVCFLNFLIFADISS